MRKFFGLLENSGWVGCGDNNKTGEYFAAINRELGTHRPGDTDLPPETISHFKVGLTSYLDWLKPSLEEIHQLNTHETRLSHANSPPWVFIVATHWAQRNLPDENWEKYINDSFITSLTAINNGHLNHIETVFDVFMAHDRPDRTVNNLYGWGTVMALALAAPPSYYDESKLSAFARKLLDWGIDLDGRDPQYSCPLEALASKFDPGRQRGMDILLELGADWSLVRKHVDPRAWEYLQRHPKVVRDKLFEQTKIGQLHSNPVRAPKL